MKEKSFFEEKGRELTGSIGLILLLLAVGAGVWVVGIVDQALHRPHEIPLLQNLVSSSQSISEFEVNMDNQESVTARFPRDILLFVFFWFLLGALGSIVGAMISSGAKLVGMATGLLPRTREKKETGS